MNGRKGADNYCHLAKLPWSSGPWSSGSLWSPSPWLPGAVPRVNRWLSLVFLPLLVFSFNGCSWMSGGPEEPIIEREGAFKVTVQSGGRNLNNFEHELVHHVSLNRVKLSELQRFAHSEKIAIPKSDVRGGFMGLSVRPGIPRNILELLGVGPGDIVTALGTKRTDADTSLEKFLLSLGGAPEASLTFERKGEPHKVLFLVEVLPSEGAQLPLQGSPVQQDY